jgi:endonuclease-3
VGRRRDRIGPIIERLAAEHSDAEIALRFRSDLELLVSVMLSAQTTDVNVNRVTPALFEKYRAPKDYLAVPAEELERDIYATGFFRQKAKAIRGTMRMLVEEFDGEVPRRLEDLVRLPGVARKTANVVAAELGHAQGIVVDTHVRRLSQRLGLTRNDDPVKIERDLQRVVPRPDWARFPHLLIWHGRRVCDARRPLCADCVLEDLCPSSRLRRPSYDVASTPEEATVDHAATMRQAYDLINAGDIDGFGALLADDFVEHEELPGLEPGKEGVKTFFRMYRAAFPDLRMDPEDVIASGDKVVARARATGTHQGDFMGMPATQRRIDVQLVDIIRFGDDGLAREHWGVFDAMTMMQQLGAIPDGPPG